MYLFKLPHISLFGKLILSVRTVFAVTLLFCFLPNPLMAQGYYNQENFGNRSILLTGNVTGSVDDLGLAYYNPSRLALIEEPNFTINAKAFQLGNIKIENVFGRSNKLSDSKFGSLPNLVAGTFKIGGSDKHKFAYSILSRKNSSKEVSLTREIDGEILEEFDNVDRFVADLKLGESENDEWLGISWATTLKDNFSIGVSTFVSIYNFGGNYNLNYSRLDTEADVADYKNEINFDQNSYGIFWKIGLAWRLPKFDIGLNIDLPFLEIYNQGEVDFKEILSGIGGGKDIFRYADWNDLESNRKEPLGIAIGAGIPIGKSKIHVKVDWHGNLSEYDRLVIPVIDDSGEEVSFAFKEELRSVINFGLGAEIYASQKVSFYASAGTDFSPLVSNANIFDLIAKRNKDTNFDADYFHFGFGIQLKMSQTELALGATYSTASTDFERPIDFPDPGIEIPANDNPASVSFNRWRFIVGLEIPIFGRKVKIE